MKSEISVDTDFPKNKNRNKIKEKLNRRDLNNDDVNKIVLGIAKPTVEPAVCAAPKHISSDSVLFC